MSNHFSAAVPVIGDKALHEALAEVLCQERGRSARIQSIVRRPSPYASSFSLEELDVRLEDGAVLNLIFKDLSRRAMHPRAVLAKPSFIYKPLREIDTYRHILAGLNLGTAAFQGAVVRPRTGRYWLFIEKVAGVRLYQASRFAVWKMAASWVAELHCRCADRARGFSAPGHLIQCDREFFHRWIQRARRFVRHRGSVHDVRRVEWLYERYDGVVERIMEIPVTVIHGEYYPVNILVEDKPAPARLCPVDWEMAAIGPGLIDLAALTAGGWTPRQCRAMEHAYCEVLSQHGPTMDTKSFVEALDCCRLHLAVQWLGWSDHWKPAPQRSYDWLSQAMSLAEQLRL